MRRIAPPILLAALAAAAHAGATFDDLSFSSGTPNYENGQHLSGAGRFTSGDVTFGNAYYPSYNGFSSFGYSKVNDTTTPGFTNEFAAITGTARSGANYGVAYSTAVLTLAPGTRILDLAITNTTYAALSMLNGDSFAKRFGGATGNDPDFFSVIATGYAGGVATGSAEFFLADYRFADSGQDYIVRDWRTFNLSGLGLATEVRFGYRSSDVGSFGINTPVYFALDDVRTQPVPEPATLAALALGLVAVSRRKGDAK